ncbi:MAG: energy transducer TonB [Wenzhouxiangella sp.]|nr:MAG: energy transducer TonB [Wenzhouxiangella sp.]
MKQGWQAAGSGDSLAMAIAVAAGLHAAVIGLVHFDFLPGRSDALTPSLDVILVDWATDEVPEQADFLAQVTQAGGGESPEAGIPEDLSLPEPEPEPAEPDLPQPDAVTEDQPPAPEDLVSLADPAELLPTRADASEALEDQPRDTRELMEQSLAMARLSPDRRTDGDDFRQQPRRKFISASTREHVYASYMSAWIAKVERIGNMNYPEAARRRNIEGGLVLSVDLLADGSVDHIRVLRSSGHDILDEAAIRIVRLSAPFAPLPEEVADQVDVLTITRTWQFSSSSGLRQTGR